MQKKLFLPLALTFAAVVASCNSKSEEIDYSKSSSVQVTAFSLTADAKVLDSLQNVFFSIDLVDAKIFNADSLPYGTKVSRLIPKVTTVSTASAVTFEFPRPGQNDSVVNYLENSTDSIDFSNGPVKLRVRSQSGLVERVYEVKVNVHKVKPDTLAWRQIASAALPTNFSDIDAQHTVLLGGKYYVLTSAGNDYCLASTANPDSGDWAIDALSLPFVPVVSSLNATGKAAYMLDAEGNLYESADMAAWAPAGKKWHCIYGAYGDIVLGSSDQGGWHIEAYPGDKQWDMPVGFPVEGASNPVAFDVKMGYGLMLTMLGGRDAEGKLSNKAWSFDGNAWVAISNKDLPIAVEDATIVAYDLFDVPSSTYVPVRYPAILAFGGKNDKGINRKVYLSKDWGMTWTEAPSLLQLPAAVPATYGAAAYVYSTPMQVSRSASVWTSIAVPGLPAGCSWVEGFAASRVSKPVTDWECPAIYFFGGYGADGKAVPAIWRAVVLRYTFPPVY